MRRIHAWAFAAIALAAAVLAGWLVLSPGWAIGAVQAEVEKRLGRPLAVAGGAHLSFSPLAVVIEQVSLAPAEGQEESPFRARALRMPIAASQIFSRELGPAEVAVEGAQFALLIDERGTAGWSLPAAAGQEPLTLRIIDGDIRFFDRRNGQSLSVQAVNATVGVGVESGLTMSGTAELRQRLARFDVTIGDVARVHDGGSPAAFTIATPEFDAGFDGRLATGNGLSLAGQIAFAMPSLRQAARWAGLSIEAAENYNALSISGALDATGRVFAVRQASISLDDTSFTGDASVDTRQARPRLEARLVSPGLDLAAFLPRAATDGGEWAGSDLGFATIKAFDADIALETPALSLGNTDPLPAQLRARVSGGTFEGTAALTPPGSPALVLAAGLDATAQPPALRLSAKAESLALGSLLPSLLGIDWLKGSGSLEASASGNGRTAQELIGTLAGNLRVTLANGSLDGIDIAQLMDTVRTRIAEGWADGGVRSTAFSTLTADLAVKDGIAALSRFTLDNPGLTVTAAGEIDLLRRAVDLEADPKRIKPGQAVADGLPVKVAVKGPWIAPRIYPHIDRILEAPEEAYRALERMASPAGD